MDQNFNKTELSQRVVISDHRMDEERYLAITAKIGSINAERLFNVRGSARMVASSSVGYIDRLCHGKFTTKDTLSTIGAVSAGLALLTGAALASVVAKNVTATRQNLQSLHQGSGLKF